MWLLTQVKYRARMEDNISYLRFLKSSMAGHSALNMKHCHYSNVFRSSR